MEFFRLKIELYVDEYCHSDIIYTNEHIENINDFLIYFQDNIQTIDKSKYYKHLYPNVSYEFIDKMNKLESINSVKHFNKYTYKVFKIYEIDIHKELESNKKRKIDDSRI
jgi:hypothetical protein